MLYLGIDPGQTGAIAAINSSLEVIFLEDYPGDEIGISVLLKKIQKHHKNLVPYAALEKVHAMPKQGVSSTFKFGTNYGMWRGALAAYAIPFFNPTPQAWQKGVISRAQDKKPALAAARRLFPSAELTGPRGGAKDGRADALLIADWCRRQFLSKGV